MTKVCLLPEHELRGALGDSGSRRQRDRKRFLTRTGLDATVPGDHEVATEQVIRT